jgi:hypothetical protein
MGLYESRGNLSKGVKDLSAKWQFLKSHWNDPQAEEIERDTLEQLEKDIRTAAEAMDAMKILVSSAKRDCAQSS